MPSWKGLQGGRLVKLVTLLSSGFGVNLRCLPATVTAGEKKENEG